MYIVTCIIEIVVLKGVKPSEYASLAHDAVWTYALALDKLIKNSSNALDHITDNKTSR